MASGNQIRLRVAGNRLKAARQRAFVGRSGAAGGAPSHTGDFCSVFYCSYLIFPFEKYKLILLLSLYFKQ